MCFLAARNPRDEVLDLLEEEEKEEACGYRAGVQDVPSSISSCKSHAVHQPSFFSNSGEGPASMDRSSNLLGKERASCPRRPWEE